MPRPLDSINSGGYPAPVDKTDDELDAVLELLDFIDPGMLEVARARLRVALEDFNAARLATVRAKTVREDLRDLERLAEVMNPELPTVCSRRAVEIFDSLRTDNPVLHRRLKWLAPGRQIRDALVSIQQMDSATRAASREINEKVLELKAEIAQEDGRGRPTDRTAHAFTNTLYQIWVDFTGKGTARQNATAREKHPFGDFVQAAGRLIDRKFNGYHAAHRIHLARRIHDGRNRPGSGERPS